ncbi:MAG: DEAD/DEAH box helicase, partial [Dehalococcoidia bacterium]|nr:DEAD/DEAH box helicase [Dehalococcoidia bacterium]
MNFESFNFHPRIADGIKALGYVTPTPIQEEAIPPIMEGRDILGMADTGTGKTAAFVLPMCERFLTGPRGRVRGLVLAPTRELAQQTHDVVTALGRQTRLRSATVYGGVGYEPQIRKLRSGVEFVVACPGRLLDLVGRGAIDLSSVEVVVLDEADRMLDMGFLPDIRRILETIPKKRQTLLFTATMPPDIRRLTRDFMYQPVSIQVGHEGPVQGVCHELYPVAPHLKAALLVELLRNTKTGPVLVFTRTKHHATRLAERLQKSGFRAASLQGDMSQSKRQATMDAFRRGGIDILVATDIAARGIDVPDISHVVNFDMPDTVDSYTHRVGRTARASRTGNAINIVTREDVDVVNAVEGRLNERLQCRKVEGFDYEAPAAAPVRGAGRPATSQAGPSRYAPVRRRAP